MGWVKTKLQNWLEIQPAKDYRIVIREPLSLEGNVVKNRIWYRGDASELDQFYKQMGTAELAGRSRFWAAAPDNEQIRKIHSGLPALMVDTIAYIVRSDMSGPEFEEGRGIDRWEELSRKIDLRQLVGKAVVDTLVTGDGAFKISFDTDRSPYPRAEFYPADRVEYATVGGIVQEIHFYTDYWEGKRQYRLDECYARGTISYRLFEIEKDKEAPLDRVPALAGLKPVSFAGDYLMAIPFRVYDSPKYPGRGKSIFDTKQDVFDAHDEVISQWMDALRAGRVAKYIPEDMIPKNPNNGALVNTAAVNSFGTNFIKVESLMNETGKQGQIDTVQPEIRYEAFLATYAATLDMCLQGIMSPATLGIDVGKMSSADAQREKKDVTGHTRNAITEALERAVPELVASLLMTWDNMQGQSPRQYTPTLTFGEYGAPDFDSRVETISKAAAASIMSVEAQVDELWGNSKDEEWKAQEVERIRQEKGIVTVEQPFVGDEL